MAKKNEMNIIPLFASPLMQIQLDLDTDKLTELAFQMRNKDKKGVEIGAYATLDTLLTAFVQAGYALYSNGFDGMSKRDASLIEMMGNCQPHEQLSAYHIYLRVLDFISGMTDQYAARLANQIRGIF